MEYEYAMRENDPIFLSFPFILKDSDFKLCCREPNYPSLQVFPGDKSKGEFDRLSFGTASGQERKGKQGKGSQEGNTPTASGQDAAPVPVQDTASGQDEATVPPLNTASGQDAAPHTASNEGKVQKGSDGDEDVGSKQEPGPESQAYHGRQRKIRRLRTSSSFNKMRALGARCKRWRTLSPI